MLDACPLPSCLVRHPVHSAHARPFEALLLLALVGGGFDRVHPAHHRFDHRLPLLQQYAPLGARAPPETALPAGCQNLSAEAL